MKGSYSRRQKKASAAYSQLRIDARNSFTEAGRRATGRGRHQGNRSHQEAASDGKPASQAVAAGGETPANTYWPCLISNTDAATTRTERQHALRSHFRV